MGGHFHTLPSTVITHRPITDCGLAPSLVWENQRDLYENPIVQLFSEREVQICLLQVRLLGDLGLASQEAIPSTARHSRVILRGSISKQVHSLGCC